MANDLVPVNGKAELSQNLRESLMLRGDLSLLKPDERMAYYQMVCDRVGVDPVTRPFDIITLDGKTVLYARKDCTEQLRKNKKISIEVISIVEDIEARTVTATVKASTPDGRTDMDVGSATLTYEGKAQQWREFKDEAGKNVKEKIFPLIVGSERANAQKKALTQAKRRVTLSICGLGAIDESEIESIDPKRIVPDKPARDEQKVALSRLAVKLNLTGEAWEAHLKRFGATLTDDLTERQADDLIIFLEKVEAIQS